jgi:hypothetical protein
MAKQYEYLRTFDAWFCICCTVIRNNLIIYCIKITVLRLENKYLLSLCASQYGERAYIFPFSLNKNNFYYDFNAHCDCDISLRV